jgi:hypothetical protein
MDTDKRVFGALSYHVPEDLDRIGYFCLIAIKRQILDKIRGSEAELWY